MPKPNDPTPAEASPPRLTDEQALALTQRTAGALRYFPSRNAQVLADVAILWQARYDSLEAAECVAAELAREGGDWENLADLGRRLAAIERRVLGARSVIAPPPPPSTSTNPWPLEELPENYTTEQLLAAEDRREERIWQEIQGLPPDTQAALEQRVEAGYLERGCQPGHGPLAPHHWPLNRKLGMITLYARDRRQCQPNPTPPQAQTAA